LVRVAIADREDGMAAEKLFALRGIGTTPDFATCGDSNDSYTEIPKTIGNPPARHPFIWSRVCTTR